MRSTQRFPLSLLVPWLRLRQSTANRIIRSPKLLVGSTPSSVRKRKSDSISSFKPADKSPRFALAVPIKGDKVAKPCKKCPPLPNGRRGFGHFYQALQLLLRPTCHSSKVPGLALCARPQALRIRCARQVCLLFTHF